jgi:hypothetical protein
LIIDAANPWGTSENSIDVQRSDLWRADLSSVLAIVKNPTGVSVDSSEEYHTLQQYLPDDTDKFVQQITLPETAIQAFNVIQGTQKRHFPGYDDPLTATRVEFFHEVTGTESIKKSGIYALLKCWFLLGMAGQIRFNRTPLLLSSASSRPGFKADITVTFYSGAEDNTVTDDGVSGNVLDESAAYQLLGCWLSDLQYPELDSTRAGLALLTATLQVGSIIPKPIV